jgi:putative intracellular protease/amidase
MGTTVNLAFRLHPVADHPALAMGAARGHRLNRAFEAVEGHGPVALGDTERLVIVVTADFALSHGTLLSKLEVSRHNGGWPVGFHISTAEPLLGFTKLSEGSLISLSENKLKGRKATSYKSIKTDMINAGAKWEDSEVVTDPGIVTSRQPADLEAFSKKIVEEIGEGRHERRAA